MSGHSRDTLLGLRALPDQGLLARLEALAAQERESAVDVIVHLMEVDRRELSIDLAYPSLFMYCVKKLGYSEAAAFLRIRAARAAAKFPDVVDRLRAGSLHLDAVARLYPYLEQNNNKELLDRASGASKREVLALVAQLGQGPSAQRDLITPIRGSGCEKLGAAGSGEAPSLGPSWDGALASEPLPEPSIQERPSESRAEVVPPLKHRFHFTADAELVSFVERLRALMRHKIPDGRLEAIFKEAARSLLERLERERFQLKRSRGPVAGKTKGADLADTRASVRARSRVVSRTVRRAVWARDGGRCAYIAPDGQRCESRDALEFDHIVPWSVGGRSDTPENIRLLCRVHNQRLGRKRFGPRRRA